MSCFLQGLLLVCEVIELVALGENQQVLFQKCSDAEALLEFYPSCQKVRQSSIRPVSELFQRREIYECSWVPLRGSLEASLSLAGGLCR